MTASQDTSAPGCASAESAPLPIRLHHAVQQQHALGSGIGPKLIDRRSPHASASRGMVTFVAGRRRGDIADSSLARTHAQSRAELKAVAGGLPNMARCESSPTTALPSDALQSKRECCLAAYDHPRSRTEVTRPRADEVVPSCINGPAPRTCNTTCLNLIHCVDHLKLARSCNVSGLNPKLRHDVEFANLHRAN